MTAQERPAPTVRRHRSMGRRLYSHLHHFLYEGDPGFLPAPELDAAREATQR